MKKTQRTHSIPRKLSSLILVALDDLEKAEKDPKFKVDMGLYFRPSENGCLVCFAGSVMAFGLGANPKRPYCTGDFPRYTERLRALDKIRMGSFHDEQRGEYARFDVTSYYTDPERWKMEMVLTAFALKEIGL